MKIDFLNKELTYKRLHGGGNGLPVAKACGVKGEKKPIIIDATAGLGKDSFLLASLGCTVIMIERNEAVYHALKDAMEQAGFDHEVGEIIDRMTLYHADASELIPTLGPVDVIYLDPMFEPRKKTALVKQAMRDLKEIVGGDHDNETLLQTARQFAKRIVVKRAKGAPFYADINTKNQIIGKTNRFDIYATTPLKRFNCPGK